VIIQLRIVQRAE